MGLQRVGQNWAIKLNWTESSLLPTIWDYPWSSGTEQRPHTLLLTCINLLTSLFQLFTIFFCSLQIMKINIPSFNKTTHHIRLYQLFLFHWSISLLLFIKLGNELLIADDSSSLLDDNPSFISWKKLRPPSVTFLNILFSLISKISLFYLSLFSISKTTVTTKKSS